MVLSAELCRTLLPYTQSLSARALRYVCLRKVGSWLSYMPEFYCETLAPYSALLSHAAVVRWSNSVTCKQNWCVKNGVSSCTKRTDNNELKIEKDLKRMWQHWAYALKVLKPKDMLNKLYLPQASPKKYSIIQYHSCKCLLSRLA